MAKSQRLVVLALLGIVTAATCAFAETEIPRTGMVATASSTYGTDVAAKAIDGDMLSYWRAPKRSS